MSPSRRRPGVFARPRLERLEDRTNPVLINNGVPAGTNGQFALDVVNGGDVATSQITAPGRTTQFTNANFIFQYTNFVRVGTSAPVNLASSTTSPAAETLPGVVSSSGSFLGDAGQVINWSAVTTIAPNSRTAQNVVSFTASGGGLGSLQLISYLDEDVTNIGDDVLKVVPATGGPNVQLFTIDQPEGVGLSQGVGSVLTGATYDGFAADQFAELRTAIQNGTATFSPAGVIDTASLPPITDPNLGAVFGPADVTTALSWTAVASATSATITNTLGFGDQATINALNGTAAAGGFTIAAGAGGLPLVNVYNPDATLRAQLFPFPLNFSGGVRVAVGDVTGDRVADIVCAAGPGGGPAVVVYDGVTLTPLGSFFAYAPVLAGGVFVAVGDVNGDGVGEIITGPGSDPNAAVGPNVKVFTAAPLTDPATGVAIPLLSFFAYPSIFVGGVRVAAADTDGDGDAEIITAAGPGGGPVVSVFDVTPAGAAPVRGDPVAADGVFGLALLDSFFAYAPAFFAGVFVAAGDTDGDGKAEIITGPDNFLDFQGSVLQDLLPGVTGITDPAALAALTFGVPSNVLVFRLTDPASSALTPGPDYSIVASFPGISPAFTGGVRVGVADLNGDGLADVITGAGEQGGSLTQTFLSLGGGLFTAPLPPLPAFDPATLAALGPTYQGSVYVAGVARVAAPPTPPPPPTPPAPPMISPGVLVATVDVNDDNVLDIITANGPGAAPLVRVFSGANNTLLFEFTPFDSGDGVGGLAVASVDSDSATPELLVGSGPGTQAAVRAFSLVTASPGTQLFELPVFAGFSGGVTVAAGALGGTSSTAPVPPFPVFSIAVGQGPGGAGSVEVYNAETRTLLDTVTPFASAPPGGVTVAIGRVLPPTPPGTLNTNALIVGAGSGGSPDVAVYATSSTTPGTVTFAPPTVFTAFEAGFRGGVTVGISAATTTSPDRIFVGSGSGRPPQAKLFQASGASFAEVSAFSPFDVTFLGGVNVAPISAINGSFFGINSPVGSGVGGNGLVRLLDTNGQVVSELDAF